MLRCVLVKYGAQVSWLTGSTCCVSDASYLELNPGLGNQCNLSKSSREDRLGLFLK